MSNWRCYKYGGACPYCNKWVKPKPLIGFSHLCNMSNPCTRSGCSDHDTRGNDLVKDSPKAKKKPVKSAKEENNKSLDEKTTEIRSGIMEFKSDTKYSKIQTITIGTEVFMTGAEWYKRFKKEFNTPIDLGTARTLNEAGKLLGDWILQIARKAAGLEEK